MTLAEDSREVELSLSGLAQLHKPRALPDHGVEGIGKHALRAAAKAAHVLEVAGLPQVLLYEAHVPLVIQLAPNADHLRREAAVSMPPETTNESSWRSG